MPDDIIKPCPKCGQKLRFPKNIGGMLMSCPSCGTKFASDFKIGNKMKTGSTAIHTTLFELPSTLLERLLRFFISR